MGCQRGRQRPSVHSGRLLEVSVVPLLRSGSALALRSFATRTVFAVSRTPPRCRKRPSAPIKRVEARDFAKFKPVSDDVFHAYQLLYAYPNAPMHETDDGVVKETADWREEKVTIRHRLSRRTHGGISVSAEERAAAVSDGVVLSQCACRFYRRQQEWKGARRHPIFRLHRSERTRCDVSDLSGHL